MKRIFGLLVAACLMSQPALAQSASVKAAMAASDQMTSAALELREARKAKDRIAALGRAVRAYESGLAAMRAGFRVAAARKEALETQFQDERSQLSHLLGVLQTIERAEAPLLLAHPSGPVGAARAALVMAEITPSLYARAETLRADLQELKSIALTQALAETQLREGLSALQTARSEISEAVARRRKLPPRLGSDRDRLTLLARNAGDLAGFAEALTQLDPSDATAITPNFETGRGALIPPVAGILRRAFNEKDAGGLARPGLILAAPPLSIVTSPWPATLRYVGNLLDYGTVAILEPQPGYLLVLAGLGEVFVEESTVIARGDPIGLLKGDQPSADEFLIDVTAGKSFIRNESLYIELRQNGTAIDPGPWFLIDRDEKGSR